MQPVGPYRFTHVLGGSVVGKAWAAIDSQGRFVTVAVLEGAVAADPRWREAFAAMADSLAQQPGGQSYAYADFSADAPWVAYPAEAGPGAEKLLRALGADYQPVPTEIGADVPVSGAPQTIPNPPQPVSGAPQPTSGAPVMPWAIQVGPVSAQPVPPHPVSAQPVSAQPVSGTPHSPVPQSGPPAEVTSYDPFAASDRRIKPSEPPRRRTGLWLGAAALVLVLVGGVGAVVWTTRSGDTTDPTASSSPTGADAAGAPAGLPTAAPQQPGIEPPRPGDWPRWPVFGKGDAVRTLTPDGLGFGFTAPAGWACNPAGSAEGQVKYNCGASIGDNKEIGGELIVRECRDCTEERRVALRKAEEAWGLQWRIGGPYVVLVETVKLDGANAYGVVVVAFWRSNPDGAIDRQLVLRMTSPVEWMDVIRRVVNSVRDNARF